MKDLKFICVQPDDTYYIWQVHLWLESLKEIGHSDKAIVLVFIPFFREKNMKWQQIIDLYPEAEFHFYKDTTDISKLLGIYIPVLRPYTLSRFFMDFPDMNEKAIFYCDSDVLFTKNFNIDKYKDDDVCYLSDTNSYINATYFDGKVRDILPEKLESYKKRDILQETTEIVGINRKIAEEHNLNSGGAQYLLKNLDSAFWTKVMNDCIMIKVHLQDVNKQFFKNENAGFQSWCADMWSVLWNLWLRGQETKNIKEMDFAWAPDPISKIETYPLFHNAGITGPIMDGYPCFYKGKYHQGANPMIDPHLDVILGNEESKKHCTWWYTSKLDELRKKYKLTY